MRDDTTNSGLSQFWAEMRRRHVVRFALGYAAAAFVVLQLAEIIFPAFGIGERGLRALVVLTTLAFLPSIVLAWVYDVTREGVRRTEDGADVPGIGRLAVGGLLVVTLLITGGLGMYLANQGMFEPLPGEGVGTNEPVVLAEYDPDAPIRSIAVLPLDDNSPSGDEAYFAASMHEELITGLSQLDAVRVVSRTSVMGYAGTTQPMSRIGEELDVDVIVEGSVIRTESGTRVTLRIIHAPSEFQIETLQWEREDVTDVLAFQSEVAQELLREVASREGSPIVIQTAAQIDPAAQEAFARGRYAFEQGTPEGFRIAFDHFEDAVEADSQFAEALAGLAGARFLREIGEGEISELELERAQDEAITALSIDTTSMEAQEVYALISRSLPAFTEVAPAIPAPTVPERIHVMTFDGMDTMRVRLSPSDTAWVAAVTSLGERIEERVRRWQSDDPTLDSPDVGRLTYRASQYLGSGRHEDAVGILERVVDEAPHLSPAWALLVRAHVAGGDTEAAAEAAHVWHDSGARGAPTEDEVDNLASALDSQGEKGYWTWTADRLSTLEANGRPVPRVELAKAHAALGDTDEALTYLGQAVGGGEPGLLDLRGDPIWDDVRKDPRFRELVRSIQPRRLTSDGSRRRR